MLPLIFCLILFCVATIFLEAIPIAFVREKKQWWRASILCNVVTNPILNILVFLLTAYMRSYELTMFLFVLLEIAVVFLEAYFYHRMLNKPYKQCLLFSFIANLISVGIGFLVLGFSPSQPTPSRPEPSIPEWN